MLKGNLPNLLEPIKKAMLIRQVEQRLLDLFSEGKLFGTVHTCIGQEWTGVAVAEALVKGDQIFSNHRCHGHYIARTDDVEGLIAEIMGKKTGMCGGRGGSQHICSQNFYSNGIQGGIVPVAAGMAMAHKLSRSGNIAVVFIGDGTLGEGILYEALNLTSKWQLPLLIVLENNHYAQSTASKQTLAGDICPRAQAFDIDTFAGSTEDPEGLISLVQSCVNQVRQNQRPVFLKVDTYRLMAHSKGDDHRDPNEVKSHWEKDTLSLFIKNEKTAAQEIRSENQKRIDEAVFRASDSAYAQPIENTPSLSPNLLNWEPTSFESEARIVELIRDSFKRNMETNERIVLLGEDIESPYGGAFKVTKGLSDLFPGRVRNTPISEGTIVGLGNGLAINGFRPVCEIMFGDFLTLVADQWINHASKFQYMYNDQITVPLIIRTPMGGKRGYGPTHSQSIEKHFLGLPNTQVLALHSRYNPAAIYDQLLQNSTCPSLVVENKLLYTLRFNKAIPTGFTLEHSDEAFPTTRLTPACAPELTILCYGGMFPDVEEAVEKLFVDHEILAEVICPLQLYPFNPQPVIESVKRTGRLLIVEEGHAFAAFGAEAVAEIMERKPGVLRHLKRLAAPPHPIPCCGPLEKEILPNPESIVSSAVELLAR